MSARATSAPKWRLTASSSSANRPVLCRRERSSVSDKPRVLTLSKVLLALGVRAADRAVLQELVVGHPERLVDLGDDHEGLVHQVAVRAFDDLGEEEVGDGVAPLVELHHAGRRLELQLGEGRAEGLAAVGEVAVHLVQPKQRSRSEERRDGQACVSTGRSRWSPDHKKKKTN